MGSRKYNGDVGEEADGVQRRRKEGDSKTSKLKITWKSCR